MQARPSCGLPDDQRGLMAQSATKQMKDLTAEVSSWCNLAEAIANDRNRIEAEADRAEFVFRHLTVDVDDDGVQ